MEKKKSKACRVLFVLGTMEVGGVQSGIMNFARVISADEVRFDILLQSNVTGHHEAEFSKCGTVYHIPLLTASTKLGSLLLMLPNDLLWRCRLRSFLKAHSTYDAIHTKRLTTVATTMEVAKQCRIPVRVAQCHVDKPPQMNGFMRWYYSWCAKRIEKSATVKLAVSPGAADLLFGKYGGRVIKNPTISLKRLDPTKFHPAPHEGIYLIQIGTYSHRKNQAFSVKLLSELLNMGIDARLTFIGFPLDEPEYIHEVEQAVEAHEVTERVRFLPKDTDVPKELSESDYMLIPSLREGLPNVALEAQAMGVPCFISETVNRETDCGLCTFLALENGPRYWAETIIEYKKKHGQKKTYIDMSAWDNEEVCKEYIKIWRGE